jgi:hypothetical protein
LQQRKFTATNIKEITVQLFELKLLYFMAIYFPLCYIRYGGSKYQIRPRLHKPRSLTTATSLQIKSSRLFSVTTPNRVVTGRLSCRTGQRTAQYKSAGSVGIRASLREASTNWSTAVGFQQLTVRPVQTSVQRWGLPNILTPLIHYFDVELHLYVRSGMQASL